MGIGPNVTRIAAVCNYTGRGISLSNPEWSADNTALGEGLHEFPFGSPVSIPWSWERALDFAGAGAIWRDGQDVLHKAGGRPSHGRDGQLVYTHGNVFAEEYIVVALHDGDCKLVRATGQLEAIFDNLSKTTLGVISPALLDLIARGPQLFLDLIDLLARGFAEPGGEEAARTLASVPPERLESTLSGLSAAEREFLATGSPEQPQWRAIFDHICSGLNVTASAFGVGAGIFAVAAAFCAVGGVPAVVCAVISGVLAMLGGGVAIAVQLARWIVDLATSADMTQAAA